jgi:hypothetical protein
MRLSMITAQMLRICREEGKIHAFRIMPVTALSG